MVCLHEDQHCAQVEVTEPEAYQFDGEYERKAAELDQPDLISIRQSNVRLTNSCARLSQETPLEQRDDS